MASEPERLRHLEDRVAALEEQARAHPAPAGEAVPDAEKFWALAGLKERSGGAGAVLFTGAVTLPTEERVEWQQGFEAESLLGTDWSDLSDVLGSLAHPVRLAVLRAVLDGVRTVADLGGLEGLGTSGQLYHHLRQLVASGWLRSTGRGRYDVPAVRVVPLLVILAAAQR